MKTSTSPALSIDVVGAGPPVLLVMGFTMRGVVWRRQVAALREHYTVATFDHRGIGASEPTEHAFTMADLGDDCVRVLDALGWSDAHVIGISMGGMAAQEMVLRHPGRVRSLSLIATQPGGPGAFLPPVRTIPLILGIEVAPRGWARRGLRRLLHPPGSLRRFTNDELRQRYEDAYGEPVEPITRRRQLRAIRRHDTRSRLSQIEAPTLVVKPVYDRLCRPSHSDRLTRDITGARLAEVPAGHGLVLHADSLLNQLLLSHLAAVDRRRS